MRKLKDVIIDDWKVGVCRRITSSETIKVTMG